MERYSDFYFYYKKQVDFIIIISTESHDLFFYLDGISRSNWRIRFPAIGIKSRVTSLGSAHEMEDGQCHVGKDDWRKRRGQ